MNNTGNTVMALLTGAALGMGVGILFAPDEGKKTRKKLKKSFVRSKSKVRENIEDFGDDLKVKAEKLKGSLEDNLETLFSRSGYKAEEAIKVLEKKIEQLKKADVKLK